MVFIFHPFLDNLKGSQNGIGAVLESLLGFEQLNFIVFAPIPSFATTVCKLLPLIFQRVPESFIVMLFVDWAPF